MDAIRTEINAILRKQEQDLAERIVERQYALQPEFWSRYGAAGREKSVRDVKYHFQYLTEALMPLLDQYIEAGLHQILQTPSTIPTFVEAQHPLTVLVVWSAGIRLSSTRIYGKRFLKPYVEK